MRSLLGAWALTACPPEEVVALEAHLTECGDCRTEAVRLRDAAGWLFGDEPLLVTAELRAQVLAGCLGRRPARVRLPGWAAPLDAEAARLDAMLRDLNESEWLTPVDAPWLGRGDAADGSGRWTVVGILCRLTAGDTAVSAALGASDPVPGGRGTASGVGSSARDGIAARTERLVDAWRRHGPERVRQLWREQGRMLVQGAALAGPDAWSLPVVASGEGVEVRRAVLRDALVERAFACWIHAEDVAEAVGQVFEPPRPGHLHAYLENTVSRLPGALDALRRAGRAASGTGGPQVRGTEAAAGARVLRLELEGAGGGEWLVPLDEPGGEVIPAEQELGAGAAEVAHLVTDGRDFCRLAAGRVSVNDVATGAVGDSAAVHDLLHAAPLVAAG
ncbi:hypothetical protein BIV57_15760 [Mangrovactinospora gilvigrisea]|uniref:Putative zinc-finger domain-containing protein n=1 Tax=Mangrovactinospora gilvigrisea TaxID=1428644 RepID=A0A1J7BST9_9ACTN|nr:hypothetical protein BIV57_15760 [Mangrovactinospora gilvigrisea]